jgi:hypothetical protein
MKTRLLLLLSLTACPGPRDDAVLDLAVRLTPIESRAGEITSEEALFSGVSAEGRAGDYKIYNDRVQFVIQGMRDGHYYVPQAGAVVDADWVRPEGQLGHDPIDEWGTNAGTGRLMDPERVYVLQPGGLFTPSIIRAEGPEAPMELLENAVETPGLIPNLGLWIQTDYILEPGSWLLRVETTVTAQKRDALIAPGDLILASQEVGSTWSPESGLEINNEQTKQFMGYQGYKNQFALGIFPEANAMFEASGMDVFSGLLDLASAFYGTVEILQGESYSWTRYYGVGPDLATLTEAWHSETEVPTQSASGTVTAPDGPVPGARVNISVDGEPYTYAVTDADGNFSTTLPAGGTVDFLADGRGRRIFTDMPEGVGPYSPYTGQPQQAALLDAMKNGAPAWNEAKGRGTGTAEAPLTLGEPAKLTVKAGDNLPFQVTLASTSSSPTVDRELIYNLIGSYEAAAWSRDGEVELLVEPGEYRLVAHRGVRFEAHSETITLDSTSPTTVNISLDKAYEHPGWQVGDPHCHAAPSPDGHITMEERLIVQAGLGIQLHFGTDHDHIADYNPMIEPLGLSSVLKSIVATEVSPVLRGHLNAYPLTSYRDEPNGGAYPWWLTMVGSTSEQFESIHERFGDFVLQVNHPINFGIADAAQWAPGLINQSSHWADNFQAMEILNSGHTSNYLGFYYDLTSRGHAITPVGVSDSHAHLSGGQGYNVTFIDVGTDTPAAVTDESLIDAFRGQRTIVSRGPFLDMSVKPGSTVAGDTLLEVNALSPSWVVIDRVELLENGEVIETVEGTTATFTLSPSKDAYYNVVASGDTPMQPVTSTKPWAISSAIYVDLAQDGWEPPLPPLEIKD